MTVEEIPADKIIVMTANLHRLFNAGGCDPWCHCCHKKLKEGVNFKLATIEQIPTTYTNYPPTLKNAIETYEDVSTTREVMLCENCTPLKFKNSIKKNLKERIEIFSGRPNSQGCFRVNGKIVK